MSTTYVATSDIPHGDPGRGVYAFRKGQTVPAHLVEEHGWQDYVSGANTATGRQAVADVTGELPAAPKSSSEKKG